MRGVYIHSYILYVYVLFFLVDSIINFLYDYSTKTRKLMTVDGANFGDQTVKHLYMYSLTKMFNYVSQLMRGHHTNLNLLWNYFIKFEK